MSEEDYQSDTVLQIETNLDDLSPEVLGHAVGLLLEAGALDVWLTPIQMKKQRPGTLLSLLCAPEEQFKFSELIFLHTSAFGLRITKVQRMKLRRDFVQVDTAYGKVTVKRGFQGEALLQVAPEYESCKAAAQIHGCPVQKVYDAARQAARQDKP
jgi:uncharacterized protein (DUF111 family)